MSNDEKTTAAPADVQQVNNKEVEEKQTIEEVAKNNEAVVADNGKTQQVEDTADANAKEATPNAQPAPAAKPPKPTVHKVDFEKNVVYLYQFSRTKNIPSPSPFCLKVETWLRMAGVKYEVWNQVSFFYIFYIFSSILSCICVRYCGQVMSAACVIEPISLWLPTVTRSLSSEHTRPVYSLFDRPVICFFQDMYSCLFT